MFPRLQQALRRIQSDLAQILSASQIRAVCQQMGYRFRERVLDPVTTIHLFVLQVLKGNLAIGRLKDLTPREFSAAAYCKARMRLPLGILEGLLERVGSAVQSTIDQTGRWLGHRTFHIDGSSFSMADKPALRNHFGQPGVQKQGCGFPVAHMMTMFHAGTGFLMKVLAWQLRTHDLAQAQLMHPELELGDILIGDRAFTSFAHLALLLGRGLHGLFRAHQKQVVDFTPHRPHNIPGRKRIRGLPTSRWLKRLGKNDQLVEYRKPKNCPEWLSEKDYGALPETIIVREVRYRITRRGCRTREVTLVTTLLDPLRYSLQELALLYGQRWRIETNLRHLKQTMKLDILHSETVMGILKELTVFALVYNLVRATMCLAAEQQGVEVNRISFADALG